MPKDFEFVEVKVSGTDVVSDRRRIRSHAARAGNNADRAGALSEPVQRNRRRKVPVWSLTIGPTHEAGRVEVIKAAESAETVQTHSEVSQSTSSEAAKYTLVPFAGNDTMIPISQSKLYPLPFLSLILNNYITQLTGAIPEVDGPTEMDLLGKLWFPMVLHSKTLFQVVVLFSASHYASRRDFQAYTRDILYIKHYALRDLQESLRRDQGSYKDEHIAAVGKLAGYEAIFGMGEAHRVHMDGLEQMLRCRGGLSFLGLNGFLARLLIFIDTNSAFLLNTRPRLTGPDYPRQESWVPPNLSKFTGSLQEEVASPELRVYVPTDSE